MSYTDEQLAIMAQIAEAHLAMYQPSQTFRQEVWESYKSAACSNFGTLIAEVQRLRTVIAKHDLCHAAGCAAEQRRLYGCAPHADAIDAIASALGEHPESTLDNLLGKIEHVRHEARGYADLARDKADAVRAVERLRALLCEANDEYVCCLDHHRCNSDGTAHDPACLYGRIEKELAS